jgi:hypothetical protein
MDTDEAEDIPSEVMSIIKEETGGLVEDTVTIQYEHWTTRMFILILFKNQMLME